MLTWQLVYLFVIPAYLVAALSTLAECCEVLWGKRWFLGELIH